MPSFSVLIVFVIDTGFVAVIDLLTVSLRSQLTIKTLFFSLLRVHDPRERFQWKGAFPSTFLVQRWDRVCSACKLDVPSSSGNPNYAHLSSPKHRKTAWRRLTRDVLRRAAFSSLVAGARTLSFYGVLFLPGFSCFSVVRPFRHFIFRLPFTSYPFPRSTGTMVLTSAFYFNSLSCKYLHSKRRCSGFCWCTRSPARSLFSVDFPPLARQ